LGQFRPTLEFEKEHGHPLSCVIGVDEVGRGCLAGPVMAAAVVLPEDSISVLPEWVSLVTDSKQLSPARREELAPKICGWARAWAVGSASEAEIDSLNILRASFLAMERAIEQVAGQVADSATGLPMVLVDGAYVPPKFPWKMRAIVKGDSRSLSIACASIVAKVHRDRLMVDLDREFPGYGLADHKGYSTRVHQDAIRKLGPTRIHRRSFQPVRERLAQLGLA
jgi:ribonuclease HII